MKSIKIIALSALSLLAVGCNSTVNSDGEQVAKNDEQMICTYEKNTGSHLKRKICRTPEQVAMLKEASKHQAEQMKNDQQRRAHVKTR